MENVTVFVRAPKTEVQATLIIKGFAEEMAIKPGEHFVSDEFLVKEVPMWLRVYPNGVNEEGFVSVYLRSRNSWNFFPFKYRFVTDVKTTEMVESHVSASDLSHDRFLSHAECREHYKQRDFVLKVEVEVEGEKVKILGKGAATMQRKPIGQEVTEAAFQRKAWTDFTLEFGGEEVACHRIILGGASPVFAAMFENQHREALEGRAVTQLSATQLSAEVGRAFVRYLTPLIVGSIFSILKKIWVFVSPLPPGTSTWGRSTRSCWSRRWRPSSSWGTSTRWTGSRSSPRTPC